MRILGIAFVAGLLGIGMSNPALSAAKKKTQSMSVSQCIDLAMKRGYTRGDVETGVGNNPARQFVLRCMQGRQR